LLSSIKPKEAEVLGHRWWSHINDGLSGFGFRCPQMYSWISYAAQIKFILHEPWVWRPSLHLKTCILQPATCNLLRATCGRLIKNPRAGQPANFIYAGQTVGGGCIEW